MQWVPIVIVVGLIWRASHASQGIRNWRQDRKLDIDPEVMAEYNRKYSK